MRSSRFWKCRGFQLHKLMVSDRCFIGSLRAPALLTQHERSSRGELKRCAGNRCFSSEVKYLWEGRTLSQYKCHKGRTGSVKMNSCFQSLLPISAQSHRQFSVLFHCGVRAIIERVRAGFALMGYPHFTTESGKHSRCCDPEAVS